jgi:predicted glycoside hydrolase/deacetylase ChbG (UPF0249 family)/glycosyltransferase involved in cell wall biosynthesis
MKTKRLLVVNADEFGRSPGINRGIVQAHRKGVVTSASAMVRRPAAEEAARLSREAPTLEVGLHLDLGEWHYQRGRWVQVERVVAMDDEAAVSREAERQLARFRRLFGRDPTHLDSHQNAHRTEPLRSVLLTMAEQLEVPLRHFTEGIFVCSEFYGQTSRGGPFPEGVSRARLLRILEALPAGVTELVCHPGHPDREAGPYGTERELELRALTDPELPDVLRRTGIELGTFAQLLPFEELEPAGTEHSFRERGRAAYERGDFDEARRWFRRATRVGGDRPWPWLWLARAELESGDPNASREATERALAILPDWPQGLLHMADLYLKGQDFAAATTALLRAARSVSPSENGQSGGLVALVSRRLREIPDAAAAVRVADALLDGHPDHPMAIAAKALALGRKNGSRSAERVLRFAGSCPPGVRNRAAAEYYLDRDEPGKAWTRLRSEGLGKGDGDLVRRTAQALRQAGELTHAWEAFDRAWAVGVRDDDTRRWREIVLGDVHVLSGAWRPRISREARYEPVPSRILHLVGKSLPYVQTGYSVRTRYVTLAQRDAGLEPEVVTQLGFPWTQGIQEAPVREVLDGIPHNRLPMSDPGRERLDHRLDGNLEELVRLIRRRRPMVLHAHSDFRNALLALNLGRAFQIPVIYEVRGFWEETWRSKQPGRSPERAVAYRWRRERELQCMAAADAVVTLADVMKAEVMKRGIPAEKIHVVPNAVDVASFAPLPRDGRLARTMGFEEGEVIVGYVSSFTGYEGIRYLIEAIARLIRVGLRVRGLLVGDGEERSALEARARELGVDDRIVFTGRVPHDQVRALYGLIDVFVVPRTRDRVCRLVTPLKPYEAMAMERAVVVSGVEALEEMILPGRTGLTFRPEDPGDLASVLEPLVRSDARRRELGRAARKWVSDHRTWEGNGHRYRALVQALSRDTIRESAPGPAVQSGSIRSPSVASRMGG